MPEVDITKLKPIAWATTIFIVSAILCSGVLFIYSFKNDLFYNLDLPKLIMISTSITCPIWLINCAVAISFSEGDNPVLNPNYFHIAAIVGSIISICIIYFPIVINFYFKFPTKIAIGIILIAEFSLSGYTYLMGRRMERRRKLKKN